MFLGYMLSDGCSGNSLFIYLFSWAHWSVILSNTGGFPDTYFSRQILFVFFRICIQSFKFNNRRFWPLYWLSTFKWQPQEILRGGQTISDNQIVNTVMFGYQCSEVQIPPSSVCYLFDCLQPQFASWKWNDENEFVTTSNNYFHMAVTPIHGSGCAFWFVGQLLVVQDFILVVTEIIFIIIVVLTKH